MVSALASINEVNLRRSRLVLRWATVSGFRCRTLIICPIAIAYSMGQIIKSVCVCLCVCLSVCLTVCEHSHGRISLSIFTKIGTDVRTPKSKNEFVGVNIAPLFPLFCPPKTPILDQEVLKTHAKSRSIYTLNVRESLKFTRPRGNRSRGTRW